MTKEEILKNIADCFDKEKSNKARNSMGVSESNYNPYYLTGKCFTGGRVIRNVGNRIKQPYKVGGLCFGCVLLK